MIKNYTVNVIFVLVFSLSTFVSQAVSFTETKNLDGTVETCNIAITCPPNQTETATPSCLFSIPDYTGLATVTDACASPTITQSPIAGTIVGLGTYTITITADDGVSIVNCTFDIDVIDTTSPTLTCPIDQVEVFDENCQFILPDYTLLASASDSCSPGSIPITQTPPPGTVISGTTTIFLFATDLAGNTGACTFDVIANDITPPTIICPADRDENADINCQFVIPDYSGSATANDNCGIPTITQIPVPGTIVGLGITVITLTASDGANSTPCTFSINVVDNRPPIVNCPEDQTEDFDVNCQFVLPDYTGLASVTDACYAGPFTMSQDPPVGTVVTGDTVVTIFAEDNAGNIGSCTFMVIQNDVTPPTITCPANRTEEVNANNCMFSVPDYTGLAIAADNCNTVTVTQNPIMGTLVGVGTTTITLTANDGSNSTSCTFDIVVQDTTTPNAVCATPFSVSLNAAGIATITALDVDGGSNDFCGILDMSIDVTSFTCDDLGPNTVTLTVQDANGFISSCSTTVTVEDPLFVCNQPPTAICQPVIVDANANCEGEAVASDFDGGSFDPEGLPTTLTVTPVGPYPLGVTNVTLTIDDGAFTDSCTTTITVLDATPPILACLEDQFEVVDEFCSFVVPDYTASVSVSDNCSTLSVTQNPIAGSIVSAGITSVEITANDGANQVSCSFNLTVVDTIAPIAICQNITVQLDASGSVTITPNDVDAGSSDNCSIVSKAIDNTTFDCNNIGENPVVFTVTDAAGLTSTCTVLVTVEDTMAPIVSCENITVVLDENNEAEITVDDINVSSTDNCGIDSYALDITYFDCSMVGDNTVTLTVTDINGNVSTCNAVVTVQDTEFPIAVCQSITVELDANGFVTITPEDLDMGSTDNCINFVTSVNILTFDCSNLGDNPVVFSITDVQGNVATCNAIVTVIDVLPPVLDCQDIVVTLDESYTATLEVVDIFGGSLDNCTILNSEIDIHTFDCSNIGENEVTLTVTDQSGNVSTCTTTVMVEEGIFAPVAVCHNVTVPLQEDGIGVVQAISFDAGSTGVRCFNGFSIDRDTFTCEDIGDPIPIELTVYNAAGETDTCIAYVNVVDGLSPDVVCPEDQSVVSNGTYLLPDYFATGEALAFDNCSSSLVTSQYPAPGTPLDQGTYTISIIAEDVSGSESRCEFTLNVENILGNDSPQAPLETIVLYPNPANHEINISNPQFVVVQAISIFDITGRVVKHLDIRETNALFTVDISNLQSASYVVVLQTKDGQLVKQLVKQ